MFRTALLSAAVAVLALPVAAQTLVKVNVNGLDAKAAHEAILRAAKEACAVELRNSSPLGQYYGHLDCVNAAVANAEAARAAQVARTNTSAPRSAGS